MADKKSGSPPPEDDETPVQLTTDQRLDRLEKEMREQFAIVNKNMLTMQESIQVLINKDQKTEARMNHNEMVQKTDMATLQKQVGGVRDANSKDMASLNHKVESISQGQQATNSDVSILTLAVKTLEAKSDASYSSEKKTGSTLHIKGDANSPQLEAGNRVEYTPDDKGNGRKGAMAEDGVSSDTDLSDNVYGSGDIYRPTGPQFLRGTYKAPTSYTDYRGLGTLGGDSRPYTTTGGPFSSPGRDNRPYSTPHTPHQPPASGLNGQRPRSKLPEFDGSTRWKSFEARVESLADKYRLNDKDRAAMLGECLKGKAADYFADLPKEIREDYLRLKSRLNSMYGVRDSPSHFQMKLATVRQEEAQSLVDFAQEINHLARQAYPDQETTIAERAAAQHFLRGCKHKDAAHWALDKEPATPEAALELIRAWLDRDEILNGASTDKKSKRDVKRSSNEPAVRAMYRSVSPDRHQEPRDQQRYRNNGERSGSRDRSWSRDRNSRSSYRDGGRNDRAGTPDRKYQREKPTPSRSRGSTSLDSTDGIDRMLRLLEGISIKLDRNTPSSSDRKAQNNETPSRERSSSPANNWNRQSRRDRPTTDRGRDKSPVPRKRSPQPVCYECGSADHFARECPDRRNTRSPGSPRRVSFEDGSGDETKFSSN